MPALLLPRCLRILARTYVIIGTRGMDGSCQISTPGFKVLSEAERTAALYSLLQHSTQVQIRFFITVLQQMARADPMTALLSPAVGGASLATIVPFGRR